MNFQGKALYEAGKKAILYLRVSTEEQVDNFSLDTQEDICRKEADKRGYGIVEVFREEGRSAKTILGRPVLIDLLEYCRKRKNKIQGMIVYRLDRVSRQTGDYLAIRKKLAECGVTIISATEPTGNSPTEKLVETVLAGFAQLDNDIRSERSRNGLRARFLQGLIVSGYAPMGYLKQAGYAVKDPETWDKVRRAWDIMATGTKSLREMAEIMNEMDLKWKKSKKEYQIRAQTANNIFRNKFYMGIMSSPTYPEEIKGQHVPMITEQQFYKVQAILDGRNVNKVALARRNAINPDFPLRRVVKCGKCGMGLTGGWSKGHMYRYKYYRCGGKCNTISIKVADVEKALIKSLKEITPKKKCLDLFIAFLTKTYHERVSRLRKIRFEADEDIEKLRMLRKTLVEKNLAGTYSDEVFKEQNAIIEEKIVKAQIIKEDSTLDKYNLEKVTPFIKTLLADLGEAYKRSNLGQIKVLISSTYSAGVAWNYNGGLNYTISPLYQAIRGFESHSIKSCAEERS